MVTLRLIVAMVSFHMFIAELLLVLRVYTVDRDTQEVVVIGCCLFRLFTPEVSIYRMNAYCRLCVH